jgi:ABC-type uncharacterized transport system permease subunit
MDRRVGRNIVMVKKPTVLSHFCHFAAHHKTRKDGTRPALFLIFVLFYVFFVLFYVYLCCSMYFCVVLCIVCFVFSVLFVCVYICTELLPLDGYPIAVKYIISYLPIDVVGWQFVPVEEIVKQIVIHSYIHVRKYDQHALHSGTDLSCLCWALS